MSIIIEKIVACVLSLLSFVSLPILPFIGGSVDEARLSKKYQNYIWDGSTISINGHVAKVENGLLIFDDNISAYPADSSVANNSKPILSDESGTWFEDHERNEIRHDSHGRNLFKLRLGETAYINDINNWSAKLEEGNIIYLYNSDGSTISFIDTQTYGIPIYTYGTRFGTL